MPSLSTFIFAHGSARVIAMTQSSQVYHVFLDYSQSVVFFGQAPSQPDYVGPTSVTRRKTKRFLTSSGRRAAERLLIGPPSAMTSARCRFMTSAWRL